MRETYQMNYAIKALAVLWPAFPLILCACAARDESAEPDGDNMAIAVDFRDVHRCSRISPEITITNIPAGTRYYDVRLIESGEKDRFLGGGTWREDGTGIIPEGALTRHYTGPCPQGNDHLSYIYVVSAMESEGGQPLEVRLFRVESE